MMNIVVKNDINELHVWNDKIGLNNVFAYKKYKGRNLKHVHMWRINIVVTNDITCVYVWKL